MKKSINRNLVWSDVFVKQLEKCGIKNVCISPGSRNTSLTIAFSKSKKINKHVIVDERSSAFFALGLAKFSRIPTVLLTTSGTAVANLYPAIIEAYNSRIPLIVLTADRPDYLLNTGANQTINQINIFKNHIRKFYNLGLPEISEIAFGNLKNIAVDAFLISSEINIGPVHINFPFEKPFEPSAKTDAISEELYKKNFLLNEIIIPENKSHNISKVIKQINKTSKGLIILGGKEYTKSFLTELIKFSERIKFPILSEGNSSIRFLKKTSNAIIVNSTSFFRSEKIKKEIDPELIIQFGAAPISKVLLDFIKDSTAKKILINKFGDLHDPSRTFSKIVKLSDSNFVKEYLESGKSNPDSTYLDKFIYLDEISESIKKQKFVINKLSIEPNLIKKIVEMIPAKSNLFISNSMPIRDFDFFASKSDKELKIFSNRGASGIDGIISSAAGISAKSTNQTFLIIGDLAFHHDSNGLQILSKYKIPLKIILVNNNGGRIFDVLPIAQEKIEFDKYFKTELNIDFKSLVKAHKGLYKKTSSLNDLEKFINSNQDNFSVAEVKTDTSESIKFRKDFWNNTVEECEKYLFQ